MHTAFALYRVVILFRSRDGQRDQSDSSESFTTADELIFYSNAPKYKNKVQIHVPGEFIKKRTFNL